MIPNIHSNRAAPSALREEGKYPARTKGLLVIPDPTISDIHLKKSNMSEVVFQEAKDGTRSHPKGFGIYSSFGGSKRGPKWA